MNKSEFEKRMYDEWRKDTLNYYLQFCETPEFDQLKDLQDCDRFYDFFHPIIGTKCSKIASVAEVCWRVLESDLTIVIADVELYNMFTNRRVPENKTLADIYSKLAGKKHTKKEIFVMCGFYNDIVNEDVNRIVKSMSVNDSLITYKVFEFNENVLSIIYSFIPRFKEEDNMLNLVYEKEKNSRDAREEDPLGVRFKGFSDHNKYKADTMNLIEKAILDYEALRKLR